MSSDKMTILFAPHDGHGHINASHGLAEELRDRGHRVVFAIDIAFKGKLIPFGFEEALHGFSIDGSNAKEFWPTLVERHENNFKLDPIGVAETFFLDAYEKIFSDVKKREHQFKNIIERIKPDIIVVDSILCSPALTNSGIPWIWLFSAAPLLCLNDNRLPPACSGLSINTSSEKWKKFKLKYDEIFKDLHNKLNKYCQSKRAQKLSNNRFHPVSSHLNVYIYPKELDYEEIQPLPSNWKRVDSFIRTTKDTFTIPDFLKTKQGKLVYLSMGTLSSANISLMKRLTCILGKSNHRFIVAKGPSHEKYELADNMYGQDFVPQTAVIPIVDLVITHGGNNTVAESFFFGKPVLVLPVFCDQFDNGIRIEETGLGLQLNPFFCTESELIKSMDRLLSDEGLALRMKQIGERMRKSEDKKIISDLIENIVNN